MQTALCNLIVYPCSERGNYGPCLTLLIITPKAAKLVVPMHRRAPNAVQLIHTVIKRINAAAHAISAQQAVLEEVCQATGWAYGESWIPGRTAEELVASTAVYCANERLRQWSQASREYSFQRGQGMIGQAWLTLEPLWWQDVSTHPDFLRGTEATEAGVHSAYAVPIVAGERFLGVLAFFLTEERTVDVELVEMVSTVVAHLGEVLLRRNLQLELEELRARVQQLDEVKDHFLQNLSHELRTPMNGIIGLSAVLKESIVNPDQREMIGLIERSADRLLRIFDRLLHLSALSLRRGRQSIEPEAAFEVDAVVESVVAAHRVTAAQKRLLLSFVSGAPSVYVSGNQRLFAQAVEYVLDNALRFTQRGSVVVHTESATTNGHEWILVSITDTGIGVPEHKQTLIFEDFRQASEGPRRAFDGVGLSLSLAKRIVEEMGGTIELESEEGRGSQFTFRLPIVNTVGSADPDYVRRR